MSVHRQPGFMTGISLLLPITLSTMAIVLLAPVLPRLLDDFKNVPNFEYRVPMILTIPALCVALLSPIAGILGDYFGRRQLLMCSFVIYAGVGVAPVFLSDLNAILLSRVGVGVAEALIMVLSTTMIGDYYVGKSRDKWLAGQTALASLSALVFFNLGGQLGAFGWRMPFWVYSSALGMLLLVSIFTWEPSEKETAEEAAVSPRHASWSGFPLAPMLRVVVITIIGSVLFYTVQIHASSGLVALGVSDPAWTGFLTSIASVGVPLGTFAYSRVGFWPVRRLLALEFALLAVGFMVMSHAQTATVFLIGCFVNQFGAGMLLPTLLVWAMNLLTFENRSRGSGMWNGAFSIGQFLSPLIVTLASKQMGGLLPAFGFLSVSAAAAALGILFYKNRPNTVSPSG